MAWGGVLAIDKQAIYKQCVKNYVTYLILAPFHMAKYIVSIYLSTVLHINYLIYFVAKIRILSWLQWVIWQQPEWLLLSTKWLQEMCDC